MADSMSYLTDRSTTGEGGTEAASYGHPEQMPDDLQLLDQLDDWEVADGETDPRGFDVIGQDGNQIGKISGLLASPSTERAYFAVVDTGGWLNSNKHLVPLSVLHFQDEKAHGPFTKERLQNAPEWKEDNRDFRRYADYWIGAQAAGASTLTSGATTLGAGQGTQELRVPVMEETAEIHTKRHQAGYVTLRKREQTVTQHLQAPVTRTQVTVETRDVPASEAAQYDEGTPALKVGDTLRVPVVEETAEVSKDERVTKEVVVRAQPEQTTVERDVPLRQEVVDVDEEGEVDLDAPEFMQGRR